MLDAITKEPFEFLNIFLEDEKEVEWFYYDLLGNRSSIYSGTSLLNHIEIEIVISWCKDNPVLRYRRIAQLITPYERRENEYFWTPLAIHILESVEDQIFILEEYYDLLWPRSWSGSLAMIMEPRVKLIEELYIRYSEDIRKWAFEKTSVMLRRIDENRLWEERRNRTEERFE